MAYAKQTSVKNRKPRQHRDVVLVFDPEQQVPQHVMQAIVDEWLVPALIESYVREVRQQDRTAHHE